MLIGRPRFLPLPHRRGIAGVRREFFSFPVRFLREFDKSDRDAATSAARLREFAKTLRALFVEGWIMVDAGSSVAGLGDSKTITQIAMEQCHDATEFRYGTKTKVLWNRTSREECETSLRELGQIVEDTLARLHVDFGQNDLYMTFEAMDMAAWGEALESAREASGGADSAAAKLANLRQKARRLCEALQVPWSFPSWCRAVKWVRKVQRRSAATTDNRVLWMQALAASQGSEALAASQGREVAEYMASLKPLFSFYVAMMDGTGDVERLLGTHAAFLEAHQGSPNDELAEVCLEIAKEGPTTEAAVCTQQEQGHLLLTPFTRQCAVLWRALYGRRFACYKQRKDAGRGETGLRLRGSVKAVKILQAKATDALLRLAVNDERGAADGARPADRPTIMGVGRGELMRGVRRRPAPASGKKILDFRKTTANRQAMKKRVKVWAGFGAERVKFRRKPGETVRYMFAGPHGTNKWIQRCRPLFSPATASQGCAPAASQGQRHTKGAKRGSQAASSSSASQPAAKALKVATPAIKMPSHTALDTMTKPSESDLVQWLGIIAEGKTVLAQNTSRTYTPANTVPTKVSFTEDFSKKHPALSKAFQSICARPGSKWQVVPAASQGKTACIQLSRLHDCKAFLQKARRLPLLSGVGSDLAAKPSLYRGTLSRFGRPLRARRA